MTYSPRPARGMALLLAASLTLPTLAVTAGCGNKAADTTATAPTTTAPTTTAPSPVTQPTMQPSMQPNMQTQKPGLNTKQKLVLLTGAALLFYLYKRDLSQNAKTAQANGNGGQPQLYREDKGPNNGAIYYRKNDPNHTVVWLQAPAQGVQVPAAQVQKYLPDYNGNDNAYQSLVNTNPQSLPGTSVQPADQYAGSASGT